MIVVEAPAKVNLTLRVFERDATGLHPLRSQVQMISWYDQLMMEPATKDVLTIDAGALGESIPADDDNLIWQAASAFWGVAGERRRVRVHLRKSLPVAAGLAGGSADAAGMIVGLSELFGVPIPQDSLVGVGADVPFSVTGGAALMEGYGERLTPTDTPTDFAMVIAVPPIELATPDVYRAWDALGGPSGRPMASVGLPPSLRNELLVNDLYPAAIAVAPELDDHRASLAALWERPVGMSGSGASLFAFFADFDEAAAAAANTTDMRAVRAVIPVDHGARVRHDLGGLEWSQSDERGRSD